MAVNSSATENAQPRLYGLVSYDRSAKVRWVMTELGMDFENVWLDREQREHESEAFLALNPMGRIPVLEIAGQVMFESGAICAYLADKHLDRALAPPLQAPERALYQQWMYFASCTLDTIQTRIMVIEDIPEGPIHTEKLATLLSDFRDSMSALDIGLGSHSYLVADRLTIADMCVAYHLYWLRLWPELSSIMQDFPRLQAYQTRLQALPSAIKADVFSYSE